MKANWQQLTLPKQLHRNVLKTTQNTLAIKDITLATAKKPLRTFLQLAAN